MVASPVRAHLKDGSTVIFAKGVHITSTTLEGDGKRYDLLRTMGEDVARVDLADVIGMETFRDSHDAGASLGWRGTGDRGGAHWLMPASPLPSNAVTNRHREAVSTPPCTDGDCPPK